MKLIRPIVGITIGDPNGIGSEITIKALSKEKIYKECKPLIIGDRELIEDMLKILDLDFNINVVTDPLKGKYEFRTLDILDLNIMKKDDLKWGEVTKMAGEASFRYIEKAINLAKDKKIDAICTGPIHKEAINKAGHNFAGHTEILAHLTDTKKVCMMLTDNNMRVSHVTTHIAMKDVPGRLTIERIYDVVQLTDQALKRMGIKNPKIAVAGYNPHSGESGLFGSEEIERIQPAIDKAKRDGYDVEGPVPPDTVFVRMMGKHYDAVVAMYHDQGHIPMKVIGFDQAKDGTMNSMSGVNVTLGLPIIRTSVDHGTAFGKAGKGTASEESMIDAIELAKTMSI